MAKQTFENFKAKTFRKFPELKRRFYKPNCGYSVIYYALCLKGFEVNDPSFEKEYFNTIPFSYKGIINALIDHELNVYHLLQGKDCNDESYFKLIDDCLSNKELIITLKGLHWIIILKKEGNYYYFLDSEKSPTIQKLTKNAIKSKIKVNEGGFNCMMQYKYALPLNAFKGNYYSIVIK